MTDTLEGVMVLVVILLLIAKSRDRQHGPDHHGYPPSFLPLIQQLNGDPVHFGMVFIMAATIGISRLPWARLCTPFARSCAVRSVIIHTSRTTLHRGLVGNTAPNLYPGSGAPRAEPDFWKVLIQLLRVRSWTKRPSAFGA